MSSFLKENASRSHPAAQIRRRLRCRNWIKTCFVPLATAGMQTIALCQPMISTPATPAGPGATVLPGIGTYDGNAAGAGRGLVIQPRITIVETYTNNANFSSTNSQSDFITEVNPGISIVSNGTRVRGYFDYSLRSLTYASNSSLNSIQRALNAQATIEAVSNWLFVDLSANISRQNISAFGFQTSDLTRNNPNVTEVSTYRISPYIRGRLSNVANYQFRFSETFSSSSASSAVSDTRSTEWVGRLSEEATSRIGWALQATSRNIDFQQGRNTKSTQLLGTISYKVVPQLRFFASAGRESNNYLNQNSQYYSVYSYGFGWRPTERTQIDAERFHRFFGEGHRLVFNHRMQRIAWQLSDIKDVVVERYLSDGTVGTSGTLFDVLFNQFASIESDPIKRTQLVNNFLQANGLGANTFSNIGFLSSSVIVQRRQQLSLSVLGIRDYFTVSANQTESRRLSELASVSNDFLLSPIIRQRGYSLQYSHTVAPGAAVSGLFYLQKTTGSNTLATSTLRTYAINYSDRLGIRTAFTIGARRTLFDGGINSYSELAVYGLFSIRF